MRDVVATRKTAKGHARGSDRHPGSGQKQFLAWPQFVRKRGNCRWRYGSISCFQSKRFSNFIWNIAESVRPDSRRRGQARGYALGIPRQKPVATRGGLVAAILPNPSKRAARNPGPGVRRRPEPEWCGAQASVMQRAGAENRELLSAFLAVVAAVL